jgi:hypothetical protein
LPPTNTHNKKTMKTNTLPTLGVAVLLAGITSTAMLSAQPCTAPPAGLVAWWSGDGHCFDLAGANHGASPNGVGFAPGMVARAFSFDGVSGYVQVTNTAAMDFGAGDFTIEGWLYFNSLAGDQEILHKVVGVVPNCQTYFLEYDSPNSLRFMVYQNAGNQNDLIVATSLVVEQWYHVAAVRSGNTNLLFLNGSPIGSQVAGNSANTGEGGIARIGNIAPNGVSGLTRFFMGMIDELSLYNRALSTSEIAAIYDAGSAGKCKPLPTLPVSLTSGSVLLSWPASAEGFGLVSRSDLTTGTWEAVANVPTLNGTRKEILLPVAPPAQRFFQLSKPAP